MKKVVISLLICAPLISTAQIPMDQQFSVYITVKADNGEIVPFTDFWLIEQISKNQIDATTNDKGKVNLTLRRGKNYTVNFKDRENIAEISTPIRGQTFFTKTIVYNPSGGIVATKMEVVNQKISSRDRPGDNQALVNIKIQNRVDLPVRNIEVRVVSNKLRKTYIGNTGNSGIAKFMLTPGQSYSVGVDEIDDYKNLTVPDRGRLQLTKGFTFQPTNIVETVTSDTVKQEIPGAGGPTSARNFVHLFIHTPTGEPLARENIYIDLENGSLVYHGISDDKGEVEFLLPKGKVYVMNFEYERGVDQLDYTDIAGFRRTEIEYSYMGSERIRDYYDTAKKDKNGFRIEFMETPVTRIGFDESLVEQTDQGYNINLPKESKTPAPAIGEDMLFIDGGYYSRQFYSFDKETGKFNWGVELGESGSSSAVYDEDIVLLITESCTLYALEAKTGKLAWSKWLGPNIYSTPTVADGKVFAVYPNELRTLSIGKDEVDHNNVLACFDLKTGEIQWQSWMESEVLASPVVSNDNVFLTSVAGNLYQFSGDNGKRIAVQDVNAVTPPTIAKGKVYVSIRNGEDKEQVAIFKEDDLSLIRKADQLTATCYYPNLQDLDADHRMNYNGSRILHYKGKNYNIMENKLICSNPESGSIIWSATMPETNLLEDEQVVGMPVAAGGKIMVPTKSDKIQIYDPSSGKLIDEYNTGSVPNNHSIVDNGWIYTGTVEGKLVSINTNNKDMTGWPMWGMNAAHNPVVE